MGRAVRGGLPKKLFRPFREALPGGDPMSPVCILKHFVSVFINACCLLSALPSLSQFGRWRLSLVAISFYVLSLLFGPCCLSEFTLAGLLLASVWSKNKGRGGPSPWAPPLDLPLQKYFLAVQSPSYYLHLPSNLIF